MSDAVSSDLMNRGSSISAARRVDGFVFILSSPHVLGLPGEQSAEACVGLFSVCAFGLAEFE